jgi:RecB family exonuclease
MPLREPSVRLVIGPEPGALLELAAEPFLSRGPGGEPLGAPRVLLALRQGGLRDDLFALASRRGAKGWFDPAICVFHELPRWLGATARRPLGDFERAALLEHLLRGHGDDVFRGREGAFLAPIERLFGELTAEGITAAAFASAVAAVPERESFETERDAALVEVYGAYERVLLRDGRRDGRDTLADVAAAVRTDSGELVERLGGRREIRVVGLADLRGGWRLLLEALSASPAVDTVALYHTDNLRVEATVERIVTPGGVAQRLFRDPPDDRAAETVGPRAEVIAARDEDAELEAVAARVRALLDDGVAPDRVAVVARDGRPYVDLAVRALAAAGVPATARRRVALLTIPVVRAVIALLDAAAAGWTRHGLATLGAQPYFATDLDVRVINFIGYRRRVAGLAAWREALHRLLDEAHAAEAAAERGDQDRRRTLPAAWVERACERFDRFMGAASPVDDARPLAGWLEWLDEWLSRDPWRIEERCARVPDERWQVVRLDLLGWRQLRGIVTDWAEAERAWPGDDAPLPASVFVERLRVMLGGDVALWTETARGVVVAEALAASHRSFDHLFLVGMNAGLFPRRAPSSLLLGERDRDALRTAGLPLETTAEWEARERALFRTLVGGARASLTVSYRHLDDLGGQANPSAFVEALGEVWPLEEREPTLLTVCRTRDLAVHAHRVARIERDRATGRPSPWNGLVTSESLRAWLGQRFGPEYVWSPTSLEGYAKCPWAWFSERLLHVVAWEDPDEDMDALVRGTVLHDALRRFYDAARSHAGGPVLLRAGDGAWAVPLLRQALREALAAAGQTLWLGHPALREVKYAELERMLERYLEFEIGQNEAGFNPRTKAGRAVRTAVESHELTFADARLERDGELLRYRGIVDRIEVGQDDRVSGRYLAAVDYKTSKYAAPAAGKKEGWEDGVVLQVPLYAHALAQLRPGWQVARVEYRAVKHAERLHLLNLVGVKRGSVEQDAESVARMEAALTAAVRHAGAVRGGVFPAAPSQSCHCPPFCHGWDICRVAGGPDDGWD